MPAEDLHYLTGSQFNAMLAFAPPGQAAEMLVFGETSTLALDDIYILPFRDPDNIQLELTAPIG